MELFSERLSFVANDSELALRIIKTLRYYLWWHPARVFRSHLNFLGTILKNRSLGIILTSLASMSIVASVTGCVPVAEAAPTQFTEIKANETTSSFLAQVKTDTATYVSQYSTVKTPEEKDALHDQVFSNSLSYLDTETIAADSSKKLLDELSMLYITEPTAEIKTYEGDFTLADNTATISSDEFEVMVDGKRKSVLTTAPLTLKLTDAGWKIAGYGV